MADLLVSGGFLAAGYQYLNLDGVGPPLLACLRVPRGTSVNLWGNFVCAPFVLTAVTCLGPIGTFSDAHFPLQMPGRTACAPPTVAWWRTPAASIPASLRWLTTYTAKVSRLLPIFCPV